MQIVVFGDERTQANGVRAFGGAKSGHLYVFPHIQSRTLETYGIAPIRVLALDARGAPIPSSAWQHPAGAVSTGKANEIPWNEYEIIVPSNVEVGIPASAAHIVEATQATDILPHLREIIKRA